MIYKIIIAALLFSVLPNIYIPVTTERTEYPKTIFFLGLVSTWLLGWFVTRYQHNKIIFKPRINILDILITIYFLILCLTTLFSISPYTSILGNWNHPQGGLLFVLTSIGVFYLSRFFSSIGEIQIVERTILAGIVFSVFASSIIPQNAVAFLSFLPLRMQSTQGNPIYLSTIISLGLPISFYLMLSSRSKRQKLLFVGLFALCFFNILLSLTRSVWVVLCILTLTLVFFYKKFQLKNLLLILKNKWILLVLIVIAGSCVYLSPLIKERIKEVFNKPFKENSFLIRLTEYNSVLKIIQDHPILGTGPETIYHIYPQYRSVFLNEVENEWFTDTLQIRSYYLHLAATTGILGLASFLSIIGYLLIKFRKYLNQKDSLSIFPIAGLYGAWLAIVIHMLIYSNFVTLQIFFWALAGLLSGNLIKEGVIKTKVVPIMINSGIYLTLLIGLILIYLGFNIGLIRDLQSSILFRSSIFENNIEKASKGVERAIKLNPFNTYYYQTRSYMSLTQSSNLLSEVIRDKKKIIMFLDESQYFLDISKKLDHLDPRTAYYQAILDYQRARLTKDQYSDYHTPEFKKAIFDADFAHRLDPTSPRVTDLLTLIYLDMGGPKLYFAKNIADITINLRYNFSLGHYHKAETLKQLGMFDEAIQSYQNVLKYNPNDEFAKEEIEKIKQLQNR